MLIGERIKEERIKKVYTQDFVGEYVGVSKVSICGYEKGTRTPSIQNIIKLAEILEKDVDYLIGTDVNVIAESGEPYQVKMSSADISIISELKKYPDLYNQVVSDIPRTIYLISRKIK